MKIQDLNKYPKKINDQLIEFRIPDPIGSLDLLHDISDLSGKGHLVGSGINQIRKRYSSIISINRSSYWALTLFSRYARKRKKKNYSVSAMIDILVGNMKENYNQEVLNDNLTQQAYSTFQDDAMRESNLNYDVSTTYYSELMAYFKRVYIYSDETEKGSFEVFLPELTFHEIPLLREYLLALVEPEIFDPLGHLWNNESLFMEMGLNNAESEVSIEKIEEWIRSDKLDLYSELRREVEHSKLEFRTDSEDPTREETKAAKKMIENMQLFKHLEDKDIREFVERFKKLKEFSIKLGKYI